MDTLYSGNVQFQVDQGNGYWITVNTAYSITGQVVSMKLRDMKQSYPNNGIRAIRKYATFTSACELDVDELRKRAILN